jgi:hypothetical protein
MAEESPRMSEGKQGANTREYHHETELWEDLAMKVYILMTWLILRLSD